MGFAVVLAPPALLVWHALRPLPWNGQTLKVRFESVRYEAGGLVFRYSVENTTGRMARFLPGETEILALQPKDRPVVGFANVRLPVDLPAHSTQPVELRLELPSIGLLQPATGDQNRAILNPQLPSAVPSDQEAPVSPLPMLDPPEKPPTAQPSVQFTVEDSLLDLDGFELTDLHHGLKLLFPRGW
jgi:hypothetical protein